MAMDWVLRSWVEAASAAQAVCQVSSGMMRFMNSSNRGTVNAVSPWLGLQIMPLLISRSRSGPTSALLPRFMRWAMSPER